MIAKNDAGKCSGLVRNIEIGDLTPAAVNDQVYRPVDPADPSIVRLAESIAAEGVLQPLHVTRDRVILSGHRRFCASKLAGLECVPCIEVDIESHDERFLPLLVRFNEQREKSFDELLREAVVTADPIEAHATLVTHRRKRAAVTPCRKIEAGDSKKRSQISREKRPMLEAVLEVLKDVAAFLPVSVRQIHYRLLNNPPLYNPVRKPGVLYSNTEAHYGNLCDLCLRARIEGYMPWSAIEDTTRPIETWNVWPNAGGFVRNQVDSLFRHYWRDLMQSQPCHVEIIGEKNTIAGVVQPIAAEYTIPLTIARGYCSGVPRKNLCDRFRKTGKERLVVVILSDHDPDGEMIASSFVRSLRDDFGIPDRCVTAMRAALHYSQVASLGLPPSTEKAKRTSSNFNAFKAAYGTNVYELEAVPPGTLQEMLRETIEGVIDRDLFDREVAQEKTDAAELAAAKDRISFALQGSGL